MNDLDVAEVVAQAITEIAEDKLTARIGLGLVAGECVRRGQEIEALRAELARRPKVVLCAVSDAVPVASLATLTVVRK